jgi:hypothetical protein
MKSPSKQNRRYGKLENKKLGCGENRRAEKRRMHERHKQKQKFNQKTKLRNVSAIFHLEICNAAFFEI